MPATGGIAAVLANQRYIGWGKQAAWGTGIAPTDFWKWFDGSGIDEETRVQSEREGDTSPHPSLFWKAGEYAGGRIVEEARPRTMGCAIAAAFGEGSDTYTAPTFVTTLAANVAVGDVLIKSTADLGNVGTLAVNLTPGTSSPTYEVVVLDLTTRTTPNFTYTIAAGGKARRAHTSGDALTTKSTHALKPLYAAKYAPHSLEEGIGVNGVAPFDVIRYIDAVCYGGVLTYESGRPLRLEHDWWACSFQRQAVFATQVIEGEGIVGNAGAPFMWHQGAGAWILDSAGTNNALTIKRMQVAWRRTTSVEDFLLEGLNPVYFTPDNIDITVSLEFLFQSWDQYYECYFGNTKAPAASATDSYLVGVGNLTGIFTADGVNALNVNLVNAVYTAAKKPRPATTAKAVTQQVMLTAAKSLAVADPFTLTLSNSRNSAY